MAEGISKRFFVRSIAGGLFLGYAAMLCAFINFATFDDTPALILAILGALFYLYGGICSLVLIYKMWASVQDGDARTTPGRAVGLLFIPLLNLWWLFHSIAGFPKDYNDYLSRHNLELPRLEPHLFVALSALLVCPSGITATLTRAVEGTVHISQGLFISLPIAIIISILSYRICDAINCLAGRPTAEGGPDLHDISGHFRERE
ncbi:MAG: hypothetical protein JW941_11965 [Candidatus Coatesbacteria bacterium]|nr:hypothetical protein [Candidatus Coatesbacteria bacterium]